MRRRSLLTVITLVATSVAVPAGPAAAKKVDDWRVDSRLGISAPRTARVGSTSQPSAAQASTQQASTQPTPVTTRRVKPTTLTVRIPTVNPGSPSPGATTSAGSPAAAVVAAQ